LDVQAVTVQTVLLLSCAGCADSKNWSRTTGYSRKGFTTLFFDPADFRCPSHDLWLTGYHFIGKLSPVG